VKREVEVDWKCQKKKECNRICPEMKSPQFFIDLQVKNSWKEKISKRKNEEEAGTGENSLADVTFGEVRVRPGEWRPVRVEGNNTERKQTYR